MDIFISVISGMIVGAAIAAAVSFALAAYHAYQREVERKFDTAKKEMTKLKQKQQETSERIKITENVLIEITTERRNI